MKFHRGFTLIETVIFILVLAVGLTGLVTLSTTTSKSSSAPLIRERTLIIAHAYMDEIISKRWSEITPVGGGCVDTDPGSAADSCSVYCSSLNDLICGTSKCVLTAPGVCSAAATITLPLALGPDGAVPETRPLFDDIDDYISPPVTPSDIMGLGIGAYTGYTVAVGVNPPGAAWSGIPAADVRRIAVTVTNPLGESLTLVSYKVNF